MKQKFVVEGANFLATVVVDLDLCGDDPYKEAATKTLEYIFRHGPEAEESEEFSLLKSDEDIPGVGIIMGVCKDGEMGIPHKMKNISTIAVAQNAGVLEVARHLESLP